MNRLGKAPGPALRAVLAAAGALVLAGSLLAVIAGPATLDRLQLGLLGLGAISLALGLIRAVPVTWIAALGLGLALHAYLVRVSSHVAVSFPFVDWIQPQSIDRSRMVPMLGILLLLLAFRATLGAGPLALRFSRGIPWRVLGLIGVAMLVHYWVTPKHFAMEVVYADDGDSFPAPIVKGGRLSTCEWSRTVVHDVPLTLLPKLIANESTRARLAHGVHEDQALKQVAAGTLSPGAQRRQSGVRNALWTVQRGAQAAAVGAIAAAAGLGLLLSVPLLVGLRLGRVLSTVVALWLLFTTLAIPVTNLALHAVLLLGGLPDAARNRWTSIALTLGFAAAVVVVDLSGRVLAVPRDEED